MGIFKDYTFIFPIARISTIYFAASKLLSTPRSGHINNRVSVGLDMAIMSRCNYTILSYGTYSLWSGFLSGGPKILPFHMNQQKILWEGNQPKPIKFQRPFMLTDAGIIPKKHRGL